VRLGGAGAVPRAGVQVVARSSGMTGVPMPVPPYHGQDTSMARELPLRSFLALGPYPEAIPCARLHARAVLWEWV